MAKRIYEEKKGLYALSNNCITMATQELGRQGSILCDADQTPKEVTLYSAKNIAAMDETGLWFDVPGNTTLEEVVQRPLL